MARTYTDEELLAHLRRLADDLGESPTTRDVQNDEAAPSYATYNARFGGFDEALRAAGLQPNRYSDDDLAGILRELAADLGRTPSVEHLNDRDDLPHHTTFRDHFGSWNDALDAAGLQPNEPYAYDRDDLLSELARLARMLDRPPGPTDLREHGAYSENAFRNHFGSWEAALSELGLEWTGEAKRDAPSDDELVAALREWGNYGSRGPLKRPSKRQMDASGPFSSRLYQERFGSWQAALVQAGLPVPRRSIDREDLLAEIHAVADEVGCRPGGPAPTIEDLAEHGEYSVYPYRREFGSWTAAVEAAGYQPNEGRPAYTPDYSTPELLTELRAVADHLHEAPSTDQFAAHSDVGTGTYFLRFGSWNRALRLAGLQPSRQSPGGTPRGGSRDVPVDESPGDPEDPRIDRLRLEANGREWVLGPGDALADEYNGLAYEILSIDVRVPVLSPEWHIRTQPIDVEKPLTRTFFGNEVHRRLGEDTLLLFSGAE